MSWNKPQILTDPPEVILECAQLMGMKVREVLGYIETDAGRVILTGDGHMAINVPADHPDALGHVGLCYYPQATKRIPATMGLPIYCDSIDEAADPHTLRDLQARVLRDGVSVPASALADVQGLTQWVGADPVRACAVWQTMAAKLDVNMQQAVEKSPVAYRMQTVIRANGIAA